LRHQVDDKTGQMTGRQGLAQAHRLVKSGFAVNGCEFSAARTFSSMISCTSSTGGSGGGMPSHSK
jgi:hypothetical protein